MSRMDLPAIALRTTGYFFCFTLTCFVGLAQLQSAMANQSSGSDAEADQADTRKAQNLKLGVSPPYSGDLRTLAALNMRDARLEVILSDLIRPSAFAFISSTELLVTEMSGQLSRFNIETGQLELISGLPRIASDHKQAGLLDLAPHPDFSSNSRIYFSYVESDEKTRRFFRTAVATAVLEGDQLHDLQRVLTDVPFGWSPSNFGGALEFDTAGFLYISIGDRSEHIFSQHGDRLEGKILRLHDDGSVPKDNPFVGKAGFDDRIFATGVRNAQGLHFDEQTGLLFEAEHGPLGGDEVNVIKAAANYGWPTITYGKNYNTDDLGEGTHKPGMQQPLFYYLPSVAVSRIMMYRGDMFSEWDGHLLVGALKGKHVSKLDLDGKIVRSEQPLLKEIKGRIRDLKEAPDGSIFILSEAGSLYRLYRVPTPDAGPRPIRSAMIYDMVCSGCHDTGADDAPLLSAREQWKGILQQPLDLTYQHTIEGINSMPERGLCSICTDEHLKATVDFMLEQVQAASE